MPPRISARVGSQNTRYVAHDIYPTGTSYLKHISTKHMIDPDAYQFHHVPHTATYAFHGHFLVSDQVSKDDVALVWRQLEQTLARAIPGDVVEFGCYVGTTSLFIRRLLDEGQQQREFHVYDSFAGLPEKNAADASAAGADFGVGKLNVSKKEFLRQFRLAGLAPPIIHKAWFNELDEGDVPRQIAFAFLDGDFHDSILDSLKLVWPRMSPGGTVLIDDYMRPELPGVERAVRDFFQGNVPKIQLAHNIAILHK